MPVKPPVWIGPAMLICGVASMFTISWPVASVVLTFTLVALSILSIFPRGCTLTRPRSSAGLWSHST